MLTRQAGFTLAELLIALAILGIIATFTIPKVLQSQGDSQKKAVFKETIAALSDTVYQGHLSGTVFSNGSRNYLMSKLNYVRQCTSDIVTEGCWGARSGGTMDDGNYGIVLHNGASIVDIDNYTSSCSDCWDGVGIDWNGSAGPNTYGDDRLQVKLYFSSTNADNEPGGKVGQYAANAASVTLWQQVFQ